MIPKGMADETKRRGLDEFRETVVRVAPFIRDRVNELRTWDDVKLLTVVIDRLTKWYRAGLLCIGDSAHAMSPVGGVGINLAIQAPWQRPISWPSRCGPAHSEPSTCDRCSSVESFPPKSRNDYKSLFRTGSFSEY